MNYESELIHEIESFWFQLMDLDGLPTRSVLPEFIIQAGGIEFKAPLHLGLQINFFSKIALRVLLRLGRFNARYFDQFEKVLSDMNLEKYLEPQKINIHIDSAKSRLFHEGNLLEACQKVLARKNYLSSKEPAIGLFLRLFKDQVTVSLDTTGEHLHFRGYRKQQGEAPLRENLAALILQLSHVDVYKDRVLFDPYCGSGTFFFESQLKNSPVLDREYAFFKFKITPAIFKSESWKKNYRWIKLSKKINYLGIEKNIDTYKKTLKNIDEFKSILGPIQIELLCDDSEKISLEEIKKHTQGKEIDVITNPPYGERSQAGDVVKSLERLEDIPQVSTLTVIHPIGWRFNFKKLKKVFEKPLSNQGLKTQISFFNLKT